MPRSARSIPTAPARCCSSSSTGRAARASVRRVRRCRRARGCRAVAVTTAATLAGLRAIVGVEHAHDGGAAVDGITPRWTAAPATTDQAAALIALAYDERLAVVPRGGGTALELGHPLTRVDLVVDMRRLDAVLEHH